MESESKKISQKELVKDIISLIDKDLENGISLEFMDNKIYDHINKQKNNLFKIKHKRTKKKKKICRPALFISDSSDNEIREHH